MKMFKNFIFFNGAIPLPVFDPKKIIVSLRSQIWQILQRRTLRKDRHE